jgi:hypothetical protein
LLDTRMFPAPQKGFPRREELREALGCAWDVLPRRLCAVVNDWRFGQWFGRRSLPFGQSLHAIVERAPQRLTSSPMASRRLVTEQGMDGLRRVSPARILLERDVPERRHIDICRSRLFFRRPGSAVIRESEGGEGGKSWRGAGACDVPSTRWLAGDLYCFHHGQLTN